MLTTRDIQGNDENGKIFLEDMNFKLDLLELVARQSILQLREFPISILQTFLILFVEPQGYSKEDTVFGSWSIQTHISHWRKH